jgi:hypothetical protein
MAPENEPQHSTRSHVGKAVFYLMQRSRELEDLAEHIEKTGRIDNFQRRNIQPH